MKNINPILLLAFTGFLSNATFAQQAKELKTEIASPIENNLVKNSSADTKPAPDLTGSNKQQPQLKISTEQSPVDNEKGETMKPVLLPADQVVKDQSLAPAQRKSTVLPKPIAPADNPNLAPDAPAAPLKLKQQTPPQVPKN